MIRFTYQNLGAMIGSIKRLKRSEFLALTLIALLFFVPSPGNSQSNVGLCGAIQNSDKRNFCMAKAKNNAGLCGAIKDIDERNMCFALVKKNKSLCGAIKDKDKRYECLANF